MSGTADSASGPGDTDWGDGVGRQWRRVVDDHMFSPPGDDFFHLPTCRMQILESRTGEVLLVATQFPEEGPSISNVAEYFITAAWQRYRPDLTEPPPMLHHLDGHLISSTASGGVGDSEAEESGVWSAGDL